MANGSSRKTPASNKASKNEDLTLDTFFDDVENDGNDDVKAEAEVKKPGAWDSTEAATTAVNGNAAAPSTSNDLPSTLTKTFPTAQPMADSTTTLKCQHCKRAVSKAGMAKHIESCLNKKQEKQRKKKEAKDARDAAARKAADSDDDDEDEASKKVSGEGSKKRKADDDDTTAAAAPAKKKKKKDVAKPPRPKAPVDVEKQCGVELPQGGQCARSLTCKSHSMGAKRAVPGRSAPYDKLLLDYQRKNQAKLQKAQFDATAPNPEDDVPSGPVDSEEERDSVMSALSRAWGGKPLYQHTRVNLRDKYHFQRIRGMVASAVGGRGGGLFGGLGMGFFGGGVQGAGGSGAPEPRVDEQGFVHARRGSVVPGARSMMAPASRKGSLAA